MKSLYMDPKYQNSLEKTLFSNKKFVEIFWILLYI